MIFKIKNNEFLDKDVTGYYHEEYPFDNSHAVNTLKNTFESVDDQTLTNAMNYVINAITSDIPTIITNHKLTNCALVCIPRSKTWFSSKQLKFKEAVSMASRGLRITDGTNYITRHTNTKTTHFKKPVQNFNNDGNDPFPGIAKETCSFNNNEIRGKNIILIDDVYTKGTNIIEDCIQALFDYGAESVIHYSICKTPKGD